MKKIILFLCLLISYPICHAYEPTKPRIIVSSDIGGTDPDDNQSMTHLLMYCDLFDIEGLVSSPSFGDGDKEEILRMIDVYEKDFPILSKVNSNLKTPDSLRMLVVQGRKSEAPRCGFGEPTEGSRLIVASAKKEDPRPLNILVWGCLEDVAQALHDAPEIAPKLRVHWIGGPNKKWGVNAYCYIVENFPDLWMIENNTTYRGFIFDSKNPDKWNAGFFNTFIKDAGNLGRDFATYYKGNPKMGDTPSLLYLMKGIPDDPESQSWAGKFKKCNFTPRRVFYAPTTVADTVPVCSILEWRLQGPVKNDIPGDSICVTMELKGQKWPGYYVGNGIYSIKHSTYYLGTLPYTITSTVDGCKPIEAQLTVVNTWNAPQNHEDYPVGSRWWTDSYASEDFWHNCAGATTQLHVRQKVMEDWASRWNSLKQ